MVSPPRYALMFVWCGRHVRKPGPSLCSVAVWCTGVQEFLHGEHRERKQYRIVQLPEYLVCHLKRFTKNTWFVEKNPTIVTFPVKNLEMKDCTCGRWCCGCHGCTG